MQQIALTINGDRVFAERYTQVSLKNNSFGTLLKIKDRDLEIDIDVSVNKILDPYNSYLVQTYALLDERFHKLALILKYWNKQVFPDVSSRLNSYSIVLMLIAYLQHEKVLPNLQQIGGAQREDKVVEFTKFSFKSEVLQSCMNYQTNIAFVSD